MKTETLNLDLLEAMGIEYSAKFVPFSQSRNKDEKNKSLNWKVTLKRNRVELTTDYMQGIAHHPDYKKYQLPTYGRCTVYQKEQYEGIVARSAETGRRYTRFSGLDRPMVHTSPSKKELPEPTLKDVFYSLILDSDVLQHESFESWAGDFGYDADSRQAEKIYQDCLKITLKINQMFSSEEWEQLREFFQDY